MYKQLFLIVAFCFSLFISECYAASYQSHASIHQAARSALQKHTSSLYEQKAEIKPGKLDSRLKLRKCSKALSAIVPDNRRGIGRVTVNVKCTDSKPWSLHVPMNVNIYKNVLVAARPLSKGTRLTDDDIKAIRYNLAKLPHGYLDNLQQTLGKTVKRQLSTGSPLTPKVVKKARIIDKGQRVTIVAQSGHMQVRTQGKALAHGAVGERIGIMNIKSKQKLEGVITASGEVRVDI